MMGKAELNECNRLKVEEISKKTGKSEDEVLNGILRAVTSPKISGDLADFALKKSDEMRGRARREAIVKRPGYYQAMEDYEVLGETLQNAQT